MAIDVPDGGDGVANADWKAAFTGVLAESGDLPIRSVAREQHLAACAQLLAEMPERIRLLGPIAVPMEITIPGIQGYLLTQPAVTLKQESSNAKAGEEITYYIFVTSAGIYAGVIREPYKRSGVLGKGDWKSAIGEDYGRGLLYGNHNLMQRMADDRGARVHVSTTADGRLAEARFMTVSGGSGWVKFGGDHDYTVRPYLNLELIELPDTPEGVELFQDAIRASMAYAAGENADEHIAAQAGLDMLREGTARLNAREEVQRAVMDRTA